MRINKCLIETKCLRFCKRQNIKDNFNKNIKVIKDTYFLITIYNMSDRLDNSLIIKERINKVCLACFLITDHIGSDESIKKSVRDISAEIIKDINKENDLSKIKSSLLSLNTLLGIAEKIKLINKNNVFLVCKEITNNLEKIDNIHKNSDFEVKLDNNSLELDEEFFAADLNTVNNGLNTDSKSKYNKNNKTVNKSIYSIEATNKEFKNRVNKEKTNNNSINKSTVKALKTVKNKSKKRLENIISVIEKKSTNGDPVNIKDISVEIIGCSEKTIQRDLQKLIKEGKLVKTGERRWSAYSIA